MKIENLPFNNIELKQLMAAEGTVLEINKDDQILRQGQFIKVIPIVLSGAIGVYRHDDNGKEVFLYTIEPSQTCAMTLQSYKIIEPSQIFATAITQTKLLAISIENSTKWMDEFKEWKKFVFKSYNSRFQELINTIDTIAFQKLDTRLLNYLKDYSKITNSYTIQLTHQKIANDLNTSREVISRLLKQMERNNILVLSRNKIQLL
ncbi:Crp/Fnr family transcriptional regulator [Tenacibaculum sp. M341]|uniref:Crp/Fnr family transcriptional regulator n=1 Tax=Tenacibaculum sp. M341 TaxID=2530339 RepID=UPI00104C4880|nr:Crp/Fnr family transcriptional regulator [Tenacibaculum sp. M341]TCI94910.1 Crp/Fnr family transcriptional regulator [Tenacibaculum sp. M341]